ncbi:NAD(P)-binding protein [Cytidiella melzeri]|nr:NAD(P)-binding protein [Cytidiella melzeri]
MSVFNLSHLKDKVVLVTGASAGIGAATAILLAKAGSNVILSARRTDALKSITDACVAAHKEAGVQAGGKFAAVSLDVGDKQQVATFLDRVPEELKQIDILGTFATIPPVLNNAGFVLGVDKIGDIAEEDFEAMFNVNVFGLIRVTQLIIKDFKARNTGHIINIGSIAGREAYAGGGIYCATKHAVRSFTGSLLREVVNTKIRVSEVQPGMVETEFSVVRFRGDKSAADKVYEGIQPLVAQDIAEEIVWVASRPPHVNIAELFVLPVNQATPTISYRESK